MSGLMPEPRRFFYRRLRRRKLNAGKLAAKIASGRTWVTEVLAGTVDSPRTRFRLAVHLKPAELTLLGWNADGTLIVPRPAESEDRQLPEEDGRSPLRGAPRPVQVHLSCAAAQKGGL